MSPAQSLKYLEGKGKIGNEFRVDIIKPAVLLCSISVILIIIIIISFAIFLKNSLDCYHLTASIRTCCVIWRHQHHDIVVSSEVCHSRCVFKL